jgi:hypothetical protein
LTPSQLGDVVILAPRLEDVQLLTSGLGIMRHEPDCTTSVGPYRFRSVPGKGLDAPPMAPSGARSRELEARLHELGYVE